jgi:hypothetical protein
MKLIYGITVAEEKARHARAGKVISRNPIELSIVLQPCY